MLRLSNVLTAGTLIVACALVVAPDAAAQERPLVVIDAGHGGPDDGVNHEGWLEKDLVLRVAFVIGAEFVNAGFDVVYTRTRDEAVAWDDRRQIAEDAGASLLLMLHANADEDLTQHGAEVYTYLEQARSARLAETVGDALRESGSAAVVEGREWGFLQSPSVPTAMIELAFMTHPVESRLLRTSAFHHELGLALAAAATKFLDRM